MMRLFPESQGNILGVLLSKKITKRDYRQVLQPAFDRIVAQHGKIRVLFDFADDFAGFDWKIILEDTRFVLGHLRQFERVAVINGPKWLDPLLFVFERITKCRVEAFKHHQRETAWAFIEGVS